MHEKQRRKRIREKKETTIHVHNNDNKNRAANNTKNGFTALILTLDNNQSKE
jgi:hypothetical protein